MDIIYTTNFANLKKLPKDIIPISICSKAPDWYNGLQYRRLAPKYGFYIQWKQTHDNEYYIKCYNEQVLSVLTPRQVCVDLYYMISTRIAAIDYKSIALICYEKSTEFCHRHLVREWLKPYLESIGMKCEEWRGDENLC